MSDEWTITAAKATGTSHTRRGTPCQDAFAYRALPGHGVVIFAVSDGAGSAKHSEYGSHTAVEAACSYMANRIALGEQCSTALVHQAMEHAIKALRSFLWKKWRSGKLWKLQDLACTLTLTVLCNDRIVVAQIGDGAVVLRENSKLHCITQPDRGEFANETRFITSKNAVANPFTCERRVSPALDTVAIMTDGIEGISLDKNGIPFNGFYDPILAYLAKHAARTDEERNLALQSLLKSAEINDLTDDDKTLVITQRIDRGVSN